MVFVAVVLGLLGLLGTGGFVLLARKLEALADELRGARREDSIHLCARLAELDGKMHGLRLDLGAQRKSLDGLTHQIEGPPSVRRPRAPSLRVNPQPTTPKGPFAGSQPPPDHPRGPLRWESTPGPAWDA